MTIPASHAAAPTPSVLQYRLITGNIGKTGGQKGSLTKCAQRFGTLLRTDADADKQSLVHELKLYQLDAAKQFLKYRTLDQHDNAEAVRAMQDETQEIKDQAQRARQQQQCCTEYDALAKLALDRNPNRSKLEKEVEALEKELEDKQAEAKKIDRVLQKREKQFQLLMQYMMDLRKTIKEEELEEAELASVAKDGESGEAEPKQKKIKIASTTTMD
eukprot:CAMPEP_0198120460 /NCGR_PEP_ID=MMETSP1442-20131203/29132_1 /TAXON_ID= /ORGANISM="Craspedostauros australis, Strain CCMP3328" /LENGTH=215 /DNA_ID=CAMNT_0043779113 /DNA_START=1 /DNA_END=645 /DNA_ORIENTATION=+